MTTTEQLGDRAASARSVFADRVGPVFTTVHRGRHGAAVALFVLVVWQLYVSIGQVQRLVAPQPLAVLEELVTNWGFYGAALAQTLVVAGLGILLGVSSGALLAVVSWWSSVTAAVSQPIAEILRAIPLVAVIPLLSRLLGYGSTTTVVITAVLTFFPTYIMVGSGLRDTPPGSHDLLAVLGASRATALRRLALPAAIPRFLLSLRLAVTLGLMGAVAAEYITGTGGLGEIIASARVTFAQPEQGWAVGILTMIIAYAGYAIITWLYERLETR